MLFIIVFKEISGFFYKRIMAKVSGVIIFTINIYPGTIPLRD